MRTWILPRNFEGLMKGTKKSIEDIGGDAARFCGGGLARFSKKYEAENAHEP
jgi:hypothetical protein